MNDRLSGRPQRTRRRFLAGMVALAGASALSVRGSSAKSASPGLVEAQLVPGISRVQIAPAGYPDTEVWAYNGQFPGPTLRVRQGERLRVQVQNALSEGTTVHWHGIRLPNAMDGVPVITQPSIAPGGGFTYEFAPPDAGTYFYHPHQRGFEQVGRGLAGALIVEEREPPKVDRDVLWVLGDLRLDRDASIVGGFGNGMDMSHAGRIGNTVTINGRLPDMFRVRAGERIRLRLINAASARIFALRFSGHHPQVIALDGQPVEPHAPAQDTVVLGPAMRADLVLDMHAAPGSSHVVQDVFYPRSEYELVRLAYGSEPPIRAQPEAPLRLPANALAEPQLAGAERLEVVFSGGMMGNMRGLPRGMAWALNGTSNGCGEDSAAYDPLFILRRGRSYVLRLVNETAWHHPIHLHGHSFRVLTRNGSLTAHREWLDTVMLAPRERAEIAFVADNPGDWMFHCHVFDHQASGMMSCLRVI